MWSLSCTMVVFIISLVAGTIMGTSAIMMAMSVVVLVSIITIMLPSAGLQCNWLDFGVEPNESLIDAGSGTARSCSP